MRLGGLVYRILVGIGLTGVMVIPGRAQGEIPEKVRQQIAELLADKDARTPAQMKLGSHLIYAARTARGQRITKSLESLPQSTSALSMRGSRVHVDVNGEITDDLIAAVKRAGGQVESAFPEYHTMQAWVPLLACEHLAERADIGSIMPAAMPVMASQPVRKPALKKPVRSFRRRTGALFSPPQQHNTVDIGGVIGEGADQVQALGYLGTGIKIGVMSDGVDSLSALQSAGSLPQSITVVQGQAGSGDEGTALMSVIYDMAPGAQMFYASAHISEANMAANIHTLVDTYHINILVDDVNWSDEGMFQDTVISQAITYATSHGVLCFTAAGNNNNFDSGTSGTWLGDFSDSGQTIPPVSGNVPYHLHTFGTNSLGQMIILNPVSPQPDQQAPGFWFVLQWDDPWNCPTNQYYLFVYSSQSQNITGGSTNPVACSSFYHPLQYIAQGQNNVSLIVAKDATAATRVLDINTGRAQLGRYSDSAVYGHSASSNEVVVAAAEVYYTNGVIGGGAIFTGGADNPVDLISSDGPRPMFFDPNGNLLNANAANPYTIAGGGGVTLPKVDITASDGVNTVVPKYNPFGGTSAAAPHAAAIGALLKSANPYVSNANIVAAMKSTALPVTANFIQTDGVFPRTQGAGIAMANLALAAIFPQVTITSNPIGQSLTIAGSGCNPGTYVTPVTMKFPTDASCTVTLANTTIPGGVGARQVFTAWSDADTANPKTITIPVGGPVTYTALYQQQYQLTTAAFPSAGGSVAALPTSTDGFYPTGTLVQLTAAPAVGYSFTKWSNDAGGTANPVFVTLSAPRSATANFGNPAVSATSLTMVSEGAMAGQTVQIPIQVGATGTAVPSNFQFDLSFDSTKLSFGSAQSSSTLTGAGKILGTQVLGAGSVRFQSTGANQTAIPAGTVATVQMTLNAQFTANGTLLTMQNCSSTNAQAVSLTTNCGTAVVESGWCAVTGGAAVSTADIKQMIKEVLGVLAPANDLTHSGGVNLADVQIVINAATGLGCPY